MILNLCTHDCGQVSHLQATPWNSTLEHSSIAYEVISWLWRSTVHIWWHIRFHCLLSFIVHNHVYVTCMFSPRLGRTRATSVTSASKGIPQLFTSSAIPHFLDGTVPGAPKLSGHFVSLLWGVCCSFYWFFCSQAWRAQKSSHLLCRTLAEPALALPGKIL